MHEILSWVTLSFLNFLWFGTVLFLLSQLVERFFSGNVQSLYRLNLVSFFVIILVVPVCFALTTIPKSLSPGPDTFTRQASVNQPVMESVSSSREYKKSAGLKPSNESNFDRSSSLVQKEGLNKKLLKDSVSSTVFVSANENRSVSVTESEQFFKWTEWIKFNGVLGFSVFYFLGLAIMNFRLARMITGFRKVARFRGTEPSDELAHRILLLSRQLGMSAAPMVRVVDWISCPAVYGVLKPIVFLPTSVLTGLSVKELDSVILHELAHIRRWDPVVVWFQRIAETFFFFHPVIWILSRKLETLREQCCDDFVLEHGINAMDYVHGLCKVADKSGATAAGQSLATAATGTSEGELLTRVRRILYKSSLPTHRISFGSFLLTFSLMIVLCGMIPVVASSGSNTGDLNPPIENLVSKLGSQGRSGREDLLKITIVNEDGKPVPGADVRFRKYFGAKWRNVKADSDGVVAIKNGKKLIKAGYLEVMAVSKDRKLFAHRLSTSYSKQRDLSRLKLSNAEVANVKVFNNDGLPLKDANVWMNMGSYWTESQTDGSGKTTIYFSNKLSRNKLHVIAMHLETGTGISKLKPGGVEIHLLPSTPFRIQTVDQNGQAAPFIPIGFRFVTDNRVDVANWQLPTSLIKTDENGEAVVSFIPDIYVNQLNFHVLNTTKFRRDFTRAIELVPDENKRVLHLIRKPKKYTVAGQVYFQGEPLKEKVTVRYADRVDGKVIDRREVETDQTGRFSAEVCANSDCQFAVVTDKWYGKFADYSFGKRPDQESKTVELVVTRTQKVTVRVTGGSDKKPMEGVSLQFDPNAEFLGRVVGIDPARFPFVSMNSSRNTDKDGKVTLGLPKGAVRMTAYKDRWSKSELINVKAGVHNKFEFHSSKLESRKVAGKVSAPKGVSLGDVSVEIFRNSGFSGAELTPELDRSGRWEVKNFRFDEFTLRASTADRKYVGIRFFQGIKKRVPELKLTESATVQGRILNENGNPVANIAVTIQIETRNIFSTKERQFLYHSVRTDQDGRFLLNGIAPGFRHKLAVKTGVGRIQYLHKTVHPKPGQSIEVGDLVFRNLK